MSEMQDDSIDVEPFLNAFQRHIKRSGGKLISLHFEDNACQDLEERREKREERRGTIDSCV